MIICFHSTVQCNYIVNIISVIMFKLHVYNVYFKSNICDKIIIHVFIFCRVYLFISYLYISAYAACKINQLQQQRVLFVSTYCYKMVPRPGIWFAHT